MSQAGTRLYQIATLWMLLTENPSGPGKKMSVFLVAAALPSLVLVKWIGKTVDRTSSRRILVVSNLSATAVCAILLAVARNPPLEKVAIYAGGFLLALCQAFIDPTLNKAVPELVGEEQIEPAIAMISSTQSMANFLGALLGAVLIGVLGFMGAVAVNAISYLVSAVCCYLIQFRGIVPAGVQQEQPSTNEPQIFENRPLLRNILVGFGLINFFGTPTLLILPVYTKTALLDGPGHLAILEAALWLGLLAGAGISSRIPFGDKTLKLGGICAFLFGFFLFLPGVFVHMVVYILALFLAGTVLGINNVKFITLFQRVVAPEVRGRFFALMNAIIGFTFPVAFLFFGFLVDHFSVTRLCLLQGTGIMIVALWYLVISPRESELYGQLAHDA